MAEPPRETPRLIAHPRLAGSGHVRVWVGAFERRAPPTLSWKLDGRPISPAPVRPLESARTVPDQVSADTLRAFTGVFDVPVADLEPHTLEVSAPGDAAHTLRVAALPSELPRAESTRFPEGWLNVLLVSCFHWASNEGLVGRIVQDLPHEVRPHLTIFLGDQVYLDLPPLKNFPDDVAWLANKFEEDYRRNWRESSALARVLDIAPSVSTPDDHEFWNNYPHRSALIQNSYSQGGRSRWQAAAQRLYEAFQAPSSLGPGGPSGMGDPVTFDIAPLSFCIADTRTFRDFNRTATLRAGALALIQAWATRVRARRLIPVFATGQSLFRETAGAIEGRLVDFELPNYGDYSTLFTTLRSIATAERKLLLLTGDVHWGRVATARSLASNRDEIVEVISSPSALLDAGFMDRVSEVFGKIGALFGRDDTWPRHHDADDPPQRMPEGNAVFTTSSLYPHKGNHVAILSFRRHAGAIEMRTRYFPLHREMRFRTPVTLADIPLG